MIHAIRCLLKAVIVGVSLVVFSVGSVLFMAIVLPLIHLTSFSADSRKRRLRRSIQIGFRLFAGFVSVIRGIKVEIRGVERIAAAGGAVVVANHPSLLDIVLLVSYMPQADCIIKGSLLRNPFFGRVVSAAYISNSGDSESVLEQCSKSLDAGNSLVIFPEGTRTVPGKTVELSRGPAKIALKSGCDIYPVKITCTPPGLQKGQKWYDNPPGRMHYILEVGDVIETSRYLKDHKISPAARTLTDEIKKRLF